jgi:ATP-dependent RNA helicase DeaD
MSFQDFNLLEPINKAITDLGYTKPSDIQEQAIPILLNHEGDFVGQAQTGTGKTAAFVIPLLQQLDLKASNVQAIVLAPTRELANQVHEEILKLGKYMDIKTTTVYGGVSYDKQITALKKHRPQVVVGTPGRIIDLINKGFLKLDTCKLITIDEADEMLNMGFMEDVQTIIDSLSADKKMWMFSATMPAPIKSMIDRKFSRPKMVKVDKKTLSNADISQFYCITRRRYYADALQTVIEAADECFGIVFCETRMETKNLSDLLLSKGISCASLHGELSQHERDNAMRKFKEKKVDLLICTDVAARGIDVTNITHVFNMGLPRQNESYVHRIGRTGRAGQKGTAISFIAPEETRKIRHLENLTGQKLTPYELPKPVELKKIKISKELVKMDKIKIAITDKQDDFKVDPTFEFFENYFSDLSKEQILKVLFSYRFNKEIRQIDESPLKDVPKAEFSSRGGGARSGGRSRRSSGGRDGNRSSRSGGGRSRDRDKSSSSDSRSASGRGDRSRSTARSSARRTSTSTRSRQTTQA